MWVYKEWLQFSSSDGAAAPSLPHGTRQQLARGGKNKQTYPLRVAPAHLPPSDSQRRTLDSCKLKTFVSLLNVSTNHKKKKKKRFLHAITQEGKHAT